MNELPLHKLIQYGKALTDHSKRFIQIVPVEDSHKLITIKGYGKRYHFKHRKDYADLEPFEMDAKCIDVFFRKLSAYGEDLYSRDWQFVEGCLVQVREDCMYMNAILKRIDGDDEE